jgi:hypothetical protein
MQVDLTPDSDLAIAGVGFVTQGEEGPMFSFSYESDNYVEDVSDLGLEILYYQRARAYEEDWDLSELPETGSLFYRFGVSILGTESSGRVVVYMRDLSVERGSPTLLFRGRW